MSIFPMFFPIPTRLSYLAFTLMICLGGTMLLAEGCVKQPKWEPTLGVSQNGD